MYHQVHATVLAGTKLAEGAAAAGGQVGGGGWGTGAAAGPVCSGQAYFVTDGRPCSLQAFVDDVLQGLGACARRREKHLCARGLSFASLWCLQRDREVLVGGV